MITPRPNANFEYRQRSNISENGERRIIMANFAEASKALESGEAVRRSNWAAGTCIYLLVSDFKPYLFKRSINRTDASLRDEHPEMLYWGDTTANDWSVVSA
jgi:hypothetical protein